MNLDYLEIGAGLIGIDDEPHQPTFAFPGVGAPRHEDEFPKDATLTKIVKRARAGLAHQQRSPCHQPA